MNNAAEKKADRISGPFGAVPYRKARAWAEATDPLPEGCEEQARFIFEQSEKSVDELNAACDALRDREMAMLKFNGILVAGAFAVFRSKDASFTGMMQASMVLWLLAMVVLLIALRPYSRPHRETVPNMIGTARVDSCLHDWISRQNHLQRVLLAHILRREARIFLASLVITSLGLGALVAVSFGW